MKNKIKDALAVAGKNTLAFGEVLAVWYGVCTICYWIGAFAAKLFFSKD